MMIEILGAVLYGLALSVLSFRGYAFQREVLKGDNKNAASFILFSRLVLISVFISTLSIIAPAIGLSSLMISAFNWGLWIFSIVSAMNYGLWALLRESWSQRQGKISKAFHIIDTLVQKIPTFFRSILHVCLNTFYEWFGSVWFVAQVALFIAMTVLGSPVIGITSLAFFTLSFMRAKNLLPGFLAKMLERFSYWMGLIAGIFIENAVLKLYAFFSIAYEIVVNVVLPRLLVRWLGRDALYLQATGFVRIPERRQAEPLIHRGISKEMFDILVEQLLTYTNSAFTDKIQFIQNRMVQNVMSEDSIKQAVEFAQKFGIVKPNVMAAERATTTIHLGVEVADFARNYVERLSPRMQEMGGHLAVLRSAREAWNGLLLLQNPFSNLYRLITNGTRAIFYSIGHLARINKEIFDAIEAEFPFVMTLEHMADVLDFVPLAGPVDFDAFQRMIAEGDRVRFAQTLKPLCFQSPKFHKISQALYERYNALASEIQQFVQEGIYQRQRDKIGTHANDLRQSIEAALARIRENRRDPTRTRAVVEAELQSVKEQMVEAWKPALGLSPQATEAEVFIAYALQKRLPYLCDQLRTGRDILWDKTQGSLDTFQKQAKHLVLHLMRLLSPTTEEGQAKEAALRLEHMTEAYNILGNLITDAGDYCATGIYGVVGALYDENVLKAYLARHGTVLNQYQKLSFYLQQERQDLFDTLYTIVAESPWVERLGFDFQDRHTRNLVLQGLQILHLRGSFNADSDLSNNQMDFLDRLGLQVIVYLIARIFLILPHGYSVKNVVARTMESGNGLALFRYQECQQAWAGEFTDPAVRGSLIDLASGIRGTEFEPQYSKIVAVLMLLDYQVIRLTNSGHATEFNLLLEQGRHCQDHPGERQQLALGPRVQPLLSSVPTIPGERSAQGQAALPPIVQTEPQSRKPGA